VFCHAALFCYAALFWITAALLFRVLRYALRVTISLAVRTAARFAASRFAIDRIATRFAAARCSLWCCSLCSCSLCSYELCRPSCFALPTKLFYCSDQSYYFRSDCCYGSDKHSSRTLRFQLRIITTSVANDCVFSPFRCRLFWHQLLWRLHSVRSEGEISESERGRGE